MYNSMLITWRDQAELWKQLWDYTVLKIRDPILASLNHTFKEQKHLKSNELKGKDAWMTQMRHSISGKKMELWNLQNSRTPCLTPLVWSDGMLCLDMDPVPWLLNGRLFLPGIPTFLHRCTDILQTLPHWLSTFHCSCTTFREISQ